MRRTRGAKSVMRCWTSTVPVAVYMNASRSGMGGGRGGPAPAFEQWRELRWVDVVRSFSLDDRFRELRTRAVREARLQRVRRCEVSAQPLLRRERVDDFRRERMPGWSGHVPVGADRGCLQWGLSG